MSSARTICPPDHKHGDTLTCVGNHGCRCEDCLDARRASAFYRRHMRQAGKLTLLRHRLVDATGTHRRLEALMTLGYSQSAIARHLGLTPTMVTNWLRYDQIQAISHDRVAVLYDRLSGTLPPATNKPERMSVHRTLRRAARMGYARPIDWDDIDADDAPQTGIPVDVDEVDVQRAVHGEQVRLTRDARHAAVTVLNRDRGYDDTTIARLLHVSTRTILRDRQHLHLPAAVDAAGERIAS